MGDTYGVAFLGPCNMDDSMSTPAYKKRARQEQQRKEKELAQYKKLLGSFDSKKPKRVFEEYKPVESYVRETTHYPSLSAQVPAGGTKRESMKYTGDYIVGIATMHKSNLVPVSREDDPVAYSTMRRN